MRKEQIDELYEHNLEPMVTRGRLQVLDPGTGERLTYFPEMGAWYGLFTWRDRERGESYRYLGVCPAMKNDLLPHMVDEREKDNNYSIFDIGEVTAINEASGFEIMLLESYFGEELPRGAWSGR